MRLLNRSIVFLHFAVAITIIAGLGFTPVAGAQEAETPPVTESPPAEVVNDPPPDVTAPSIIEPADLFVAAVDASGAVVEFAIPGASDDVDGPVAVSCDWMSGALFPLGTSIVTCRAWDVAGNGSGVDFLVTVTDQTAPVMTWPPDVLVTAPDASGVVVTFATPYASDNVDGAVAVICDWASGAVFPVGTSTVSCWASDSSGNAAAGVSFSVVVEAPPPPPPADQEEPAPDLPDKEPNVPDEGQPDPGTGTDEEPKPAVGPVDSPDSTPEASATVTPTATETPEPTATATATATATTITTTTTAPTVTPEPTVPAALGLPWPYPGNFTINYYGGPLNGIDLVWGYQDFPISQEYGHTEFSIMNSSWYTYGTAYGLDGFQHPGLDIGMPAGTWLYSPVEGTVQVAGGVPGFSYYGNWGPGVGLLLIVTDGGDEIVLGHMGAIGVGVGERVSVGQFVGLSGGLNGDHLHLEVREVQSGGWFAAVDPRQSVIVQHIEMAMNPVEPEDPEPEVTPEVETAAEPGDTSGMDMAAEPDPYSSIALRVPDLSPVTQAVLLDRQLNSLIAIVPEASQ